MSTNKLGKNIRNLRIQKQLTQQDVATRVPCNRSFVAQVELGIRTPGLDTLHSLAAIFAVSVSTLLQ